HYEPWRWEMVSIKERLWAKSIFECQHEQKVMNFIAEEQIVTLEMIVEKFPWIRWGDLFSILGRLRREGLVTVHQKDMILEVRIKEQTCEVV
ncbi:MAG: hypothetical protein QNK38_03615, partial [Nitrospirota bacterium]|nr:hypothetical protein [Nitrospirota bacterium]MDX2420151.1 hypothetical protein [Nitrospirota bacterium]